MLTTAKFLWQFCRHPSQTGAVAPSSKKLAKTIVEAIGPVEPGKVVVELGAGTGVFTKAIRKLLPDNPLLAIERNPAFAAKLRTDFPDVHIAETCASEIASQLSIIGKSRDDVAGVISGLPLLSLPAEVTRKIFASLSNVLPEDARFVNFTYSKRSFMKVETPGFEVIDSRRVWRNIPPANVMILQHC